MNSPPGSDHLNLALGAVAARLPAYPGAVLLAIGANLALGMPPSPALAPLAGRTLRLRVMDAGLDFDFRLTPRGFAACRAGDAPVVTISACARDFVRLARGEADPDTLFFDRRLSIEGDTELGLLLKNTLDALDLREVFSALPGPLRLVSALRASLAD